MKNPILKKAVELTY